jgi:hypothetical protein
MKYSYKVIVKTNQGAEKSTTYDVPEPSVRAGGLKIKAVPGARYQLIDNATGQGPDNIRVKRVGKDLHLSYEGRENDDVVITDYYEHTASGFSAVIGETNPGVYHPYIPESGQTAALMGNLPDGATHVGMALGAEQVDGAGAAVGTLVAAAGFNPLWALPLALLGAGGGGGAAKTDTTPPKVSAAKLHPEDDTGVTNTDGITSDNTPKLLIDADADATQASVTLNGKTYTSTTKNAQGQFVVQIPDVLGNGPVTYSVVVKDAAGNASEPLSGTPFVVDASSTNNYNPLEVTDGNKGVVVNIVSISKDSGVSDADFNTADNTLTFNGTVANAFVKNGDFVELHLLNSKLEVVASQYVEPVNTGGQWVWSWDGSAQKLADGTYKLTAQVVDKAGNAVGAGLVEKDLTIDTNANPDVNSQFAIAVKSLDQDSGTSPSDFLTNQQKLSFKGSIGSSNIGFTGKVLVQLLDTDGLVKSQSYVDPAANGSWSYDNTSQNLGVPAANIQYVLKASVVDLAGNILKSTDQSFTVDLKSPEFSIGGGSTSDQVTFRYDNISPMKLKPGTSAKSYLDAEAGTFTFWQGQMQIDSPNPTPGSSLLYDPGEITITYTDSAGNSKSLTNQATWVFGSSIAVNLPSTVTSPSTFGNGELAESIGKYILSPVELNLDLSSLQTLSPQVGGVAAINHFSLSGGGSVANADHVLTLTTSDVLALGVKNSFISNGHVQMRIDGDAADKVVLDDLLGGSTYTWATPTNQTLNGSTYHLYSNADLGLDLLIQQMVQVNLA